MLSEIQKLEDAITQEQAHRKTAEDDAVAAKKAQADSVTQLQDTREKLAAETARSGICGGPADEALARSERLEGAPRSRLICTTDPESRITNSVTADSRGSCAEVAGVVLPGGSLCSWDWVRACFRRSVEFKFSDSFSRSPYPPPNLPTCRL